VHRVNTGSRPS